MSLNDKNILITPNVGANDDPKIVFSAANTTANAQNITMRAYPTSNGTLSIEGSAGQLFSVTNQLTGTLFSVNDISGIPSIQVQDTGQIQLAPFGGYVTVSANVASNSNTTGSIQVLGGIGVRGNVYADAVYSGNVLLSSIIASNVVYISGIDTAQNARMTIIESTNASQNVRLDYSNAAITIIQGTDTSQNSRMAIIEGVDATQNTNIANKLNLTGSLNQTVSGNVTIGQDLIVAGNLIITGNINSQNVQQLAVADPLIVLGIGNYVSDTKDIGFAAHYNDGTNAHAGLIRDSGTKEFYIFQGYTPELDANNNVIITDPSFRSANLNANVVKANLIASNVSITSTITSTSNTTGALVVAGGIGTAGPIYSTGGSITINNGLATTGNSGTIFLGDGYFTKTYGSIFTFSGGVSTTTLYGTTQVQAGAGTTTSPSYGLVGTSGIGMYFPTTGTIGFVANTANALFVSAPSSSVNYLQITGNTTGGGPTISGVGSDSSVDLNLNAQNLGSIKLRSGGAIGLEVYNSGGGGQGAYWKFGTNFSGTNPVAISSGSSGTFSTSGAGNFQFYTNTVTTEQFRITNTASAINFPTITGASGGGHSTLSTAGSDTYRNLRITTSTGGNIDITRGYSSAVANSIGIGPVGGLITDTAGGFWRGLHLYAPNYTDSSGNYQFPRSSQYFEFNTLTNPTVKNYYYSLGNTSVSNTINFIISNTTGGDILFNGQNSNSNDVAFKIVPANVFTGIIHANYIQVTGGAAGSGPSLTAQGSDPNAYLLINSKGTGDLLLKAGTSGWVSLEPGGSRQFAARYIASAVNYLTVWGSAAAGNNTTLSAEYSSSANVAINLVPKGNAAVMITGNTTGIIAAANSIYVGDRVGYANANNISVVYQSYNSSTNSLDVVFG